MIGIAYKFMKCDFSKAENKKQFISHRESIWYDWKIAVDIRFGIYEPNAPSDVMHVMRYVWSKIAAIIHYFSSFALSLHLFAISAHVCICSMSCSAINKR